MIESLKAAEIAAGVTWLVLVYAFAIAALWKHKVFRPPALQWCLDKVHWRVVPVVYLVSPLITILHLLTYVLMIRKPKWAYTLEEERGQALVQKEKVEAHAGMVSFEEPTQPGQQLGVEGRERCRHKAMQELWDLRLEAMREEEAGGDPIDTRALLRDVEQALFEGGAAKEGDVKWG